MLSFSLGSKDKCLDAMKEEYAKGISTQPAAGFLAETRILNRGNMQLCTL
jgi:hypothetical protein